MRKPGAQIAGYLGKSSTDNKAYAGEPAVAAHATFFNIEP
jgi:hypothetical protein